MLRLEHILGLLFALYLLVGRWTPGRLSGEEDADLLLQPRTWAVAAVAVIGAIAMANRLAAQRGSGMRSAPELRSMISITSTGFLALVYAALTALWSPWEARESGKVWEVLLLIVFQFGLIQAVVTQDLRILRDWFWRCVVGVTFVMAVAGVATTLSGRAAVLGGGPNVFGRNMGLMMLGNVHLLSGAAAGATIRTAIHTFLIALGGMLVVMSGSRGAMLSAASAWLVLALLKGSLRMKILLRGAVVVGSIWAMLTGTELGREVTETAQVRILQMTFQERNTSERDELFLNALEAGLENPLFGLGLDSFRFVRADEYPHNFFLEAFAEGGGVGLLLTLLFVVVLARSAWRSRRTADPSTLAALALVMTAAQFSGDLYDARGIFLCAVLAVASCGASAASLPMVRVPSRPYVPVARFDQRVQGLCETRFANSQSSGGTPCASG